MDAKNITKRLLNSGDLAEVLGVSRAYVYRLSSENPALLPPTVNLPGDRLLRWRVQDVDRWIEERVAKRSWRSGKRVAPDLQAARTKNTSDE